MRVLGNILWLVLGGIFSTLGWFLAGILLCITIIGIPIGLQCFKFARVVLCPFGAVVEYGNMNSGSVILNVLWILFFGLELAMASLVFGAICCITIVGIPFGLQHFKFAGLALLPFGAKINRTII